MSRRPNRGFGKLNVESLENRLLLAGDGLTGNGAPNGEHFTLNIIGTGEKNIEGNTASGHVIFVPYKGKTKISLFEGDEFAVLDKDGTDKEAAFQLPNPGLDPYEVDNPNGADTEADYSAYVRPLGKPGGFSTITTCADVVESELAEFLSTQEVNILQDMAENEFGGYCSIEQVGQEITFREKGKSKFTDVTAELLTVLLEVQYDSTGDGELDSETTVRIPLFDSILENEYWEYDNQGLRLLQVRFYEIPNELNADNALHVAGDPSAVLVGQELTQGMLKQATHQATAMWASEHGAADLSSVDVRIGRLSGTMLGYATHDTIWIDNNAAGYGWSLSQGLGVDLLDVLEHEFGHVLGLDHDHGGVMEATLAPVTTLALAPTDVSVGDFLLPTNTPQRDVLFGALGQNDEFDTFDFRFDNTELPVTQKFRRLNRLSQARRTGSDTLEEKLESLEAVFKDVDAT